MLPIESPLVVLICAWLMVIVEVVKWFVLLRLICMYGEYHAFYTQSSYLYHAQSNASFVFPVSVAVFTTPVVLGEDEMELRGKLRLVRL